MIEVIYREVMGEIFEEINPIGEGLFTIMVDETQDVENMEQISLCIRFIAPDQSPRELFVGFVEASSTTGEECTRPYGMR